MFSPINFLRDCINAVTQERYEKSQTEKLKNILPIKNHFHEKLS